MNKIAIREVKVYQTDDGKKIEEHKTILKCKPSSPIEEDDWEQIKDIVDKDNLYFGCMTVQTPMGSSEIKFHIEDAINLIDAYEKIEEHSEKAITQLKQDISDHQNQIVTANPGDLDMFSNFSSDGTGIII